MLKIDKEKIELYNRIMFAIEKLLTTKIITNENLFYLTKAKFNNTQQGPVLEMFFPIDGKLLLKRIYLKDYNETALNWEIGTIIAKWQQERLVRGTSRFPKVNASAIEITLKSIDPVRIYYNN